MNIDKDLMQGYAARKIVGGRGRTPWSVHP